MALENADLATTPVLPRPRNPRGAAVGVVCRKMHAQDTAHSVRQILCVLALAKKRGIAVVKHAATTAPHSACPSNAF